jgi:hypothetical protein
MQRPRIALNIVPLYPRWTRLIDLVKPSRQAAWYSELAWYA